MVNRSVPNAQREESLELTEHPFAQNVIGPPTNLRQVDLSALIVLTAIE